MVRRTAVLLTLAVLAPAAASASAAEPVHVLDGHHVEVRHDRYLPPPDPVPPAGGPLATAASAGPIAPAAGGPTVTRVLRTLRDDGDIEPDAYRTAARAWHDAGASLKKLSGTRYAELKAVMDETRALAAEGLLTAGRVPVVFEILARNRQWWTTGSLLSYGARVRFTGSRLVWQEYPGHGIQPQWLGTFGEANAFWKAHKDTALEEILDDALALASPRAGGIAWESFFWFSGAEPIWVSALSQGTGIQALSRGSQRLDRPDLLDAATKALGIFQTRPPVGVRLKTKAGAHYLIYSTAPHELVLNAFLQSLNGLFDYTEISGDPTGQELFDAGDAEARREVPRYDTGAWSLYDGRSESSYSYHDLVRQFLANLCDRTGTAIYCDTAQRFADDEKEPPTIRIRTTRGTAGASVPVVFTLSKISTVSLFVDDVPIDSATLSRGTHTLSWAGRRKPGTVSVRIDATDLAGNKASVAKVIRLRRRHHHT